VKRYVRKLQTRKQNGNKLTVEKPNHYYIYTNNISGDGIATSYELDDPPLESWQIQEIFSSSKPSIPAFGAYPVSVLINVVVIYRWLSDRVVK
jgi:hypothetical protein